ncbi:MAG: phosphodiesterase [Chloroflexaceae bacterium]|nr:phosphodiesterase [Chloroflexaceae bacterium]
MPVKLLIIGLDCAEPSLVFERWRQDLPNLSRLMNQGTYGRLESCIPAITVPAWSCLLSGRDPGELGIYGFRNRADRSYNQMAIANSHSVKFPRLWNYLSDAGWKVVVVNVPGTYPPQLVNGALVSGCLTPDTTTQFTHPPSLGEQVAAWVERYRFDVENFRSHDKNRILKDIYDLCNQTFTLALNLQAKYDPDFLMLVELGLDRVHHAFWKYMDSRHPLHEPGSPLANVIYDYYCHLDRSLGKLLAACEDATVLVVSDHGAQPLMGGFCLNQWLIQEGYLKLAETPEKPAFLEQVAVDWPQTQAWGAGGYYGRIFLNVQGREPQGTIPLSDYEAVRDRLVARLEAIPGSDGQPLGVAAYRPQQLYQRVRGIAPDLIVYFQNLAWRSVGTIGLPSLYTLENDTGPDDANHAQHGLLIFCDPHQPGRGEIDGCQLYDILPTLLSRYQLEIPSELRGETLFLS